MSDLVRIGIIGCGAGRLHAREYVTLDDVALVALAGLEEDRCREVAAEYDIPRIYRDYTELLAQPDIDGVSICVPNHLHAPITIAALEAGKHVLVEKPMATSVADGEAMNEAAARTGRVLMTVFNRRFRKDCYVLKRHVEAGNLGEVYFVRTGWLRDQGIPGGAGGWFFDKARSGGGCLIDVPLHRRPRRPRRDSTADHGGVREKHQQRVRPGHPPGPGRLTHRSGGTASPADN